MNDFCKQSRDVLVPTNSKRYNTAASFNQMTAYMGVFCRIAETKYTNFEFWLIVLNLNVLRLYILITFAKWKWKNVYLVFACCLIGCVRKCPSLNHLYLFMFQSECIAIPVQWRRGVLF